MDAETGLENGRKVGVILRANKLSGPPPGWKPGTQETAAGMTASSWSDEDDRILGEIHQQRKQDFGRAVSEGVTSLTQIIYRPTCDSQRA